MAASGRSPVPCSPRPPSRSGWPRPPRAAGGSIWPQLALVGVLVVLNAAFAGSEIALVSLSDSRLQRLEERGRTGRTLAALARDPGRYMSTIQIGITLAGFLAAAAGATTLAQPLVEPLSFLGAAARPTAILLVTVAISFVTLVFGELAPKRLAMQRAEGWSLVAARPLSVLARLTAPAVWLLTRSTDLTVRLFGGDPEMAREEVTEEELRDMVAAQPLSREQQSIIEGAFEVAERSLREILVPRNKVHAVGEETPVRDAIRDLVESGHSRAPVIAGDLDHVAGIVHLRDLVDRDGAVGQAARPAIVMPETVQVLDALARLREQREQMAIVIGEHGGTEGIVTLEDLLEEIVGEIYDEYDRDLNPADPEGVQRDGTGAVTVPGTFAIHDLPELGFAVPQGEYATVAGLVLARLGRLPDLGEAVDAGDTRLEVLERGATAIERLRLTALTSAGDG